jgi:hypothetical protein
MDGLLGSSVLAPEIVIGARRVQLGEIVRRAQQDSELSPADWNHLEPIERDWWLVAAIYAMRDEATTVYDA